MSEEHRCTHCGSLFEDRGELAAHLGSAHTAHSHAELQARTDEEVAESFPASDAPSSGPVQRTGAPMNECDADPSGPEHST